MANGINPVTLDHRTEVAGILKGVENRITAAADAILRELEEGNRRFREGRPFQYRYAPGELRSLAAAQHPKVAVIACSDSRVSPEVVFDQPLGTIFSSRVPGNVASDGAKWMVEIGLGEFHVPLVMVMGHTGCLAVGQFLAGDNGGADGTLGGAVSSAVNRARMRREGDLYRAAIEENVSQTVEHLVRDLPILRTALLDGETCVVGGVYNMETGEVEMIETDTQRYGKF